MSPLTRFEHCDWRLVPHHLHHQLESWLTDGTMPKSGFLFAVLCGDRAKARREGTAAERAALVDLRLFLTRDCLPQAFGSGANVIAWAEIGGWRGMRDLTENTETIYEPWRGRLWKPGNGDDDD
jgi:hypothetical protein